jgi:D-3-phosphoglycerate dehydrogenase
MARIAVTDGMAEEAVEVLTKAGHEVVVSHINKDDLLAGALQEFDAIIVRSATKLTSEVISASAEGGGKLKVIGRAGVGVDNIELSAATKHGIAVVNAPRASTQSVIELTIGHLISCIRHIPLANEGMRLGKWEKKQMKGTELSGKALGLIGFGRIAQGVAKVAQTIGMEVHAYDPYLPKEIARSMNTMLHQNVNDIFRMCTHISIHCNLSEETHHLVNSDRIAMMPGKAPNGIVCGNHVVNCARGGIVDEKAVLDALNSGELASVALDVFEKEPVSLQQQLLQHPNFHGTPHIGAATLEAQRRVGLDIAEAVMDAIAGREMKTLVNKDVL